MASCHTHAACYVLPQNTPNSQNLLQRRVSHGFHRFTQILRVRCSPTEFTEYTEFGSVGMAGMPYPPTSVLICAICGRLFSARSFCAFRAFCGNLFPPTDFSLGGYGILPYPRHLLWDSLPQNTPNSQNLLLRCPPTDFTDLHRYLGCAVLPQNSQNTQNLAAWVLQGCHTLLHLCASVLICGRLFSARSFCEFRAFCGSPFSARGSVYSVHSVGASSPLVRLVQQRLLHPLAESTEVVCTSHHLTISPQQHHFTSNPAFCMSSQYCGYDFVTTCGSLMRSPGNTMAAGANAIAMRWSS